MKIPPIGEYVFRLSNLFEKGLRRSLHCPLSVVDTLRVPSYLSVEESLYYKSLISLRHEGEKILYDSPENP